MSDNDFLTRCTLEDLGRKGYKMYQLKEGFRFGTDSALLAWFAAGFIRDGGFGNTSKVTAKRARALELGAGCGACSLLLLARKEQVISDAVELMPMPCRAIEENIKLNKLENRLFAYCSDIRELKGPVKERQYDLVFFNPPFFKKERGTIASEDRSVERVNGRFEENGGLDDFVKVAAARVIPSSGHVVMIMKGNRLTDSINAFQRAGIVPVRLMTVHSFEDKQASMILLAGKRGVKEQELRILPPLILNTRNSEGETVPTEIVQRIYNEEHTECFI